MVSQEDVREYLRGEFPNYKGFIEHPMIAEMAIKFAKKYHEDQMITYQNQGK